ncbi:MAG: thiamine pyrophosphate-dependent enzyme [Bacillota bacterium]|jgi:2-oxoglutarate ferredoxin oxidoreductase subunit beta|nr:thiamine pyrophosphate-dependent enzyme [Bacillota bacterium]MDD3298299.1 thiamine pyrophosphate-dependent enzyme [Bacillota bacterium]MDD3850333.1 thiamine pyrophosphate-dependent enzyme [Bacillota bacterium]MDD4707005.1 thiamine pyrophosphate-dependent enzyme [Bacillota bacterium]
MSSIKYDDYLLKDKLPLFWCGGCGNGNVLGSILRAFANLKFKRQKTVVVTGIGCWGKADDYINTNTFHGTHGRALAFATGIKLANPDLNVIALMGDGDGATIGGNHLIHAARRNVDITAVLVNNFNYGMTGGQYSGTTPEHSFTSTSRYGHIEEGFDLCKLAAAAGAPFVARGTVYGITQLDKLVEQALCKKGFSFVEVITPCPTHFGRLNGLKTASLMLNWIKENSVTKNQAEKMSDGEIRGKFVTGVFVDVDKEDYSTRYKKLQQRAAEAVEGGCDK